jgi:hypothetical protein
MWTEGGCSYHAILVSRSETHLAAGVVSASFLDTGF